MKAAMQSASRRPLKIDLLSYKIVAGVCMLFFMFCSVAAFLAKQYGPSAFFWVFILLGVYMLLSSGTIQLDERGVSHTCVLGRYRMLWSEVEKIEVGTQGTLVLHGPRKRFVLAPASYWSGPDTAGAVVLLERKILEQALTPYPSRTADYKSHKNVKI